MKKQNCGNAAIRISLDPHAFEKELLTVLREKAKHFAATTAKYGKRYDAEEIACAALPVLHTKHKAGLEEFRRRFPGREMTVRKDRLAWRCEKAVRVSAQGGDIGTGTPLEADLAGRKLGYRTLKPWNAESVADYYKLPPSGREPDGITREDLIATGSPLANLRLSPRQWKWITARTSGASHIEAARACGKTGSDKACESFSLRMEANIRRIVTEAGFNADYDSGRNRTPAKPLPTSMPEADDDWRDAVTSGRINLLRGI